MIPLTRCAFIDERLFVRTHMHSMKTTRRSRRKGRNRRKSSTMNSTATCSTCRGTGSIRFYTRSHTHTHTHTHAHTHTHTHMHTHSTEQLHVDTHNRSCLCVIYARTTKQGLLQSKLRDVRYQLVICAIAFCQCWTCGHLFLAFIYSSVLGASVVDSTCSII